MQKVSKEYKETMKKPFRNRGYIKATIGIINNDAQDNIVAPELENDFTYFSDSQKIFSGYEVEKIYATAEQEFSKVDGSMYFLPISNNGMEYYNNGAVSNVLNGSFYVDFNGTMGYDIKGLTIDFGEYYPTSFTVEWDEGNNSYTNASQLFITEDVFYNVSYFKVTALAMVNGQGRLRIYQFSCGISKTFLNKDVLNYSLKDYVSPITETIPSQDMSLEVDNQNLYYSVDNPESAFSFFEVGQEIRVAFGYDVTGNGDIEWLPPNTCYLKTWKADDVKAKFTATDQFDYLTGKYYKGEYKPNGISLYNLAIDVLNDSGITDERDYYIDPYLKNVIVYNPMPAVKHSEALQIIANAGRCILYQDRKKRIRMKASFVPDMEVSANNQTEYSNISQLLKDTKKSAYAVCSNDFSIVDGSLFFIPETEDFIRDTGYVSNSIADSEGYFEENPKITITLEAAFVAYGILIKFRNVCPEEFVITTFYEDVEVQKKIIDNTELEYSDFDEFDLFDRMEIEFTKGYPDSSIFIDSILINDITDYTLSRNLDIINNPTGERESKIKSISVQRTVYRESTELKEIKTEEIVLNSGTTQYEIYFTKPVYGLEATLEDSTANVSILYQSCYMAIIEFSNIATDGTVVKYAVKGYEYVTDLFSYTVPHNQYGEEKTWKNPLISTVEHAKDLEEWLSAYYLGDVSYNVKWRGDPRTDANDLFYLELKNRETTLIRAYEKQISFSGAWQETIKARKAVLSWQ